MTYKALFFSLMVLLISGCSTVSMVDNYQQNQLSKAGFEPRQLTLDEGGELHYWQGGDPSDSVIILLHGFGGTGMTSWYEIMQDLVQDYHVIGA